MSHEAVHESIPTPPITNPSRHDGCGPSPSRQHVRPVLTVVHPYNSPRGSQATRSLVRWSTTQRIWM
ncbi:unnamed protein product [Vitrella brassicaformis CCMP3155]|uniref:Uncharacterized protein n=1 Tax=Vitrella brassicaformis (strain CCMP3155) TaxID=1169540 RepID=A0A0G4GJW0_VITBC|nr:unnamed protein product [Vitrella brassicaformis CCMP3155]|eukprot:CEM30212.1 unnamed protein product [Vitrella brassicaformis CCMP3155]